MSTDDKTTSASAEMPRYQSHKTVWALEIKTIEPDDKAPPLHTGMPSRYCITPADLGYVDVICLPAAVFQRYMPVPGDFIVHYEDDYWSPSPRKPFLEGYRRIISSGMFSGVLGVDGGVSNVRNLSGRIGGGGVSGQMPVQQASLADADQQAANTGFGATAGELTQTRVMRAADLRRWAVEQAIDAQRILPGARGNFVELATELERYVLGIGTKAT